MQIHLVDGTFELFRAYYTKGVPKSRSQSGQEVGAVRQLMRNLLTLVERDGATHVAVAFDHVIESFRNRLFDGYKRGDGIEPELREQFTMAEHAAHALGFVVWPMVEFEADDALAAAAYQFADKVDRVIICSPDKDMTQCVDDARGITTWDRIRGRWFDEAAVYEKFGLKPHSIADYLALVGDPQDGIPGIARWGAKSTATVLAHYEHLENIPDDSEHWAVNVRGAKGLAANLAAQRKDAELYKTLATLRTDVPLKETVADLEWRGAEPSILSAFCEEVGSMSLLDRVPARN
ncbi:MAG: 5'-3' exonuclease H3TH domain-containing protein [Myxococcota bacterium]|nr:5'-3' exonuclease H3TH domain-containing protein [Myxococcota bacterium]